MEAPRCLCCGEPLKEGEAPWHKSCIRRFFSTTELPELSLDEEALSQLALSQLQQGSTIAGVQKKLSLHLNLAPRSRPRLTIIGYPNGYILKPQSKTYKQLPELEHTAMLLADHCGIQTVPHALLPLNQEGEIAFISKRIDRQGETKIHMEDFCQAIGLLTENKYRSSYEECMALIDRHSAHPMLDKSRLFQCLYFSFVIGNSDFHLKNLSFIMDEQGRLELSPFYDLLPTRIVLPNDHDDLGLLFDGRHGGLHHHNFDSFCEKVGIPKMAKNKIMAQINACLPDFETIIMASPLHQDAKTQWIRFMRGSVKCASRP